MDEHQKSRYMSLTNDFEQLGQYYQAVYPVNEVPEPQLIGVRDALKKERLSNSYTLNVFRAVDNALAARISNLSFNNALSTFKAECDGDTKCAKGKMDRYNITDYSLMDIKIVTAMDVALGIMDEVATEDE